MANLRILNDNLADRAASITANNEAGALVVENVQTDDKTEVHRTTGTTAIYALTWSTAQTLNMAALAFTNLTADATIKAEVFTLDTDVVPALDTGAVTACGYSPFVPGGEALGVNLFPYGSFTYGRVYFAATAGKKLVITVEDPTNPAGYIEVGRLITGSYWSPTTNATGEPQLPLKSNTAHKRDDAGNLRTELRPHSRSLRIDLSHITTAADRNKVYDLLRGNGMYWPVFVSLFPDHSDAALEQQHQLWGRLNDSILSSPTYGLFAAPLEIEEI
jgi:hypothetical protein